MPNTDRQVILGMGAGQCGSLLLSQILSRQPGTRVTHEQAPWLPWVKQPGAPGMRERLQRILAAAPEPRVGDVASFYLPYVEEAIRTFPEIRIICLKRPREEVVAGFSRFLDQSPGLAINHWAKEPAAGWHHDPLVTRIFPQFDTQDRDEGIRRYWDEYYAEAEQLERRFPGNVRVWDTGILTTEAGVREVLTFAGIPAAEQVIVTGRQTPYAEAPATGSGNPLKSGLPMLPPLLGEAWVGDDLREKVANGPHPDPLPEGEGILQPTARPRSAEPNALDPRKCVILLPFLGFIHNECEESLKVLERRGYTVRRVAGYANIDVGRNQMATDVLREGFEETLWIDSDIGFDPDAVERLRSHRLPMVCGVYPKKGHRALACEVMPSAPSMVFGEQGGLVELKYAATGFLLVRREVYSKIQSHLRLPMCNERFGQPMIPFFLSMLLPIDDGYWYLGDDYAFCHRAREAGFRIFADTSIRLWHIGTYRYGWEDAGIDRQRFSTFTLNFNDAAGSASQ